MEYAVETFSLTKIFSDWWGRNKIHAVDDLNLQVRYNKVFGLLGPNGSGKTTTLKLLLGLLHPTKGKTVVLGGDSTDTKISAKIGFLPEESYLYKYLNARETLDFYGQLFALPAKLRKSRIETLLDMVGLRAVANRPVGTFSKGMARRIGLAQALINDPELLILDEPTTGLDPIGTKQIKDLILQLAKRGKTILLCSHLLADVEDVCDRIAILYGGKIQSEGGVKQLLQRSDRKEIIMDCVSDAAIEKIKRVIDSEHARYRITCPMEKLETFFINTIMAAQQQAQPTSGAISTTKIGDFLTFAADKEQPSDILEKLVSAQDRQPSYREPAQTDQPVPGTSELKPDEDLLEKLTKTGQSKIAKTEPVKPQPVQPEQIKLEKLTKTGQSKIAKTEPVKPQPVQPEQIKKDVLDHLADIPGRDSVNQDDSQTDSTAGDSSDA